MKVFTAFCFALVAGFAFSAVSPNTVIASAAPGQLMNLGRHGECKIASAGVGISSAVLTDGGVKGRSFVSVQNQTSGEVLRCTFDGQTTPTQTQGVAIPYLGLYSDNLTGEVNVQCICSIADGGTCLVSVQECK